MIKKIFGVLVIVCILGMSFNSYSNFHDSNKYLIMSKQDLNNPISLKKSNDNLSYALGASLGTYMKNSFREQEKLGVFLNDSMFISGIQDSILGKSKLSSRKISELLKILEYQLQHASKLVLEKKSKENAIKGQQYIKYFSQLHDVRKTKSGLFYHIDKMGKQKKSVINLDKSIITVHYKGSLVNGTEFDSSYSRGKPLVFTIDNVIPAWKEALKLIHQGGKIKIVTPPELAYGNTVIPGVPINSTLIFDIEILDIKTIK